MKRIPVHLCISSLLCIATVLPGFSFQQSKAAQAAAPTPVALHITAVKVKLGMGLEFENLLKTDVLPAMKKAGLQDFSVWKTEQFGDAGNYYLVSPAQNLAELDKPTPLAKALGPEGIAALMSKLQPLVETARMYSIEGQPNLTIQPKPGYVYKIGVLVTNDVAPGREPEFERNSKEIMTLVGKTNAKGFETFRLGLGGNPNEYTTLVPFDSFADMAQFEPAFMKALAATKLSPEAGIVVHREYEVVRYAPELSIVPPPKPPTK